MIDKIILGNCLEKMLDMPAGIFRTCITSPPYWGLRDYGLEPVVWDGDPECSHEWLNTERKLHRGSTASDKALSVGGAFHGDKSVNDSYCVHCGAWLGCLGLEPQPEMYICHLVQIFSEVKRVLKDDGTLWLVIGDSYNAGRNGGHPGGTKQWKVEQGKYNTRSGVNALGLKPKDMVLIPFRLALALQADGWWIRSDIIWHKKNVMPSSVKDRPTTDFEHVFLLAKSRRYYYDQDAIREPHKTKENRASGMARQATQYRAKANRKYTDEAASMAGSSQSMNGHSGNSLGHPKGRNKRTVWAVNTRPYKEAHYATFPPALITPMILAGSAEGDIVFDPFAGSGTTLAEAKRLGRHYCGIEANPHNLPLIEKRIRNEVTQFNLDF